MNLNSKIWYAWNWFSFLPLLACLIYRYFTRVDYKKVGVKSDTVDTLCRLLLFPSIFYYVIDSLLIMWQIYSITGCNFSFWLHHVITLAGFRESMTVTHYPWFFLAAFPCHCLLIMFPDYTDLNYLYLAIILYCMYSLRQEPWKFDVKFRWIFKVILALLLGPLVLLWLFECKNDMQNVD